MKKIFTSIKAFALLAMLLVAGDAMAMSDFYAYYAQVNASPSGKGTVYATDKFSMDEPASDLFKSCVEVQSVSAIGSLYVYAKPADGYQLAGISTATFDESGAPVYTEQDIKVPGEDPFIVMTLESAITDPDSATVASQMPLDPNNVFYALFTRVIAKPADDQMAHLGKVTISDVTNDTGDVITITAVADYDESAKFEYWIKESTGEKIMENPLTITVADKDTYKAYFTSDYRVDIDFGQEESYMTWYHDTHNALLGDVKAVAFGLNSEYISNMYDTISVDDNLRYSYFETYESGYIANGKEAYLLKGKGVHTLILEKDTIDTPQEAILQYAKVATSVSELPVSAVYYNINTADSLLTIMAPDAVIPQGGLYAAVPVSYLLEGYKAPEKIYWSSESVIGQTPVVAGINSVIADAQDNNTGVFTLDGKKLDKITKAGVYVVNGKTVIIK